MRIRQRNSETLLISAIINSAEDPNTVGAHEDMFNIYLDEYRFLSSWAKTYNKAIGKDEFLHKFPRFPLSTEAFDIQFALEELRRSNLQKSLVRVVNDITDALEDGDVENAVLAYNSFEVPFFASNKNEDALQDFNFLEEYSREEDAIDVPWETLQDNTGGIRQGELWYIAARLSQGKSWTLGTIARTALLQGKTVKFYSLEMPAYQVKIRMHTLLGAALGLHVDHKEMRDRIFPRDNYMNLLSNIADSVPGKLYIHDTSMGRVTPMTLMQDEADLIIVDYAGLMSTNTGGRAIDDWRSMGVISNMLKEVAMSNHTRVIAAAQVNRDGDVPGRRPPKVKNLAQSDSLGQDADVVITHKQLSKSVQVYGLEKNRDGASQILWYSHFLPNSGLNNEISRIRADDIVDEETADL